MHFDYNIALLTPMYEQDNNLLGHLWHQTKKGSLPLHWGQQYPDLDAPIVAQTSRQVIGTHRFCLNSKLDQARSLGILGGLLRAFGAGSVSLASLAHQDFSLEVELTDYVRPAIPRAVLSRMHDKPLPVELVSGGHWFACYAQHQALCGTLDLKYMRTSSFDLAAELEDEQNGQLKLKSSTDASQLFSFQAQKPLAFGVSLQHLWESGGRVGRFGTAHEDIKYVGM